jgi:hypothetical protein
VPVLAAISMRPRARSSIATYGRRSAAAMVSTIAGSMAIGVGVFSSREAKVDTTRYGSSVRPKNRRFTLRCNHARSGCTSTATVAAAAACCQSWSMGGNSSESAVTTAM